MAIGGDSGGQVPHGCVPTSVEAAVDRQPVSEGDADVFLRECQCGRGERREQRAAWGGEADGGGAGEDGHALVPAGGRVQHQELQRRHHLYVVEVLCGSADGQGRGTAQVHCGSAWRHVGDQTGRAVTYDESRERRQGTNMCEPLLTLAEYASISIKPLLRMCPIQPNIGNS